jgi:hypothetical protein
MIVPLLPQGNCHALILRCEGHGRTDDPRQESPSLEGRGRPVRPFQNIKARERATQGRMLQ